MSRATGEILRDCARVFMEAKLRDDGRACWRSPFYEAWYGSLADLLQERELPTHGRVWIHVE